MGRLSTSIGKGLASLGGLFSFPDALIVGGLAGVFYGLHGIRPALAFTIVGAVVFLLGLVGTLAESGKDAGPDKGARG